MTPNQKRALLVRGINKKLAIIARVFNGIGRDISVRDINRSARKLAREAQTLAQKTDELLAHDKENGDA